VKVGYIFGFFLQFFVAAEHSSGLQRAQIASAAVTAGANLFPIHGYNVIWMVGIDIVSYIFIQLKCNWRNYLLYSQYISFTS
jgi:hypothetical protein